MNNLNFRFDPLEEPKKRSLKHEWQAFAYKVWHDLQGTKGQLKQVMRLVRDYNDTDRGLLSAAYTFSIDYAGKIPRLRLFFWKFWQLKKGVKV